jgi:polyhydroxyalkanoate synthesis regulator phasin
VSDSSESKGTWKDVKQFIRTVWNDVSEGELEEARDRFDRLVDTIQDKTDEARSRISKRIEKFVQLVNYKFDDDS